MAIAVVAIRPAYWSIEVIAESMFALAREKVIRTAA
jgi:hypothetical protein